MAEISGTAQLVALWLAGKSPHTQDSYEGDIRSLIGFLLGRSPQEVRLNDFDLRSLSLNDLLAFADALEARGYAAATRHRRLAAVKSLLHFGQDVGWLSFNAGRQLQLPASKDTLAERILSELEVMTLAALTPTGRDRLLVQFLYYTGARVGEVGIQSGRNSREHQGLRWRDLKPGREGAGKVTLFGKGQKTRVVLIPAAVYQGLLELRVSDSPNAPVFASRQGDKPLTVRQIRRIVAAAGERAGIAGVSCHWLRHSHATHALNRQAPPQLVRQTLGHSSLETTTKYAHADPRMSSGLYLPQ